METGDHEFRRQGESAVTRIANQQGLSTIETLVAMTLFAIAAAALAGAAISSTVQTARSKIATAAAGLVEDQIEQLRALDPAMKPWQLQPGTYNDPNNPLTAAGVASGKFYRSWSVTANTPSLGLARVRVTVRFDGPTAYQAEGVTYVCTTVTCS
jgi:Tfp pilus assembly protein PilV